MRALILAAGLGTRLRPLTRVRAKAAVPVNGIPLAGRAIAWLVSQGIDDLVVNLHHHPASIARLIGDGRTLGARVRYSWEHPVLGSAGGPRRALPLLVDDLSGGDSFLMVNGDTLTSLSLPDFMAAHLSSGALVTMALIENPRPDVYGGVRVEDGWVRGFTRPGSAGPSLSLHRRAGGAGAGVRRAGGRRARRIGNGLVSPADWRKPARVRACVVDAPFSDIGTPADYLQTSLLLAASEGNRMVGTLGVSMDSSAAVLRTAVWDRVTIGKNCTLEECIVCDGVRVPDGASYRRMALVTYDGQPVLKDERVEGGLLLRAF